MATQRDSEIVKFSAGGKTFFFNKNVARNGTEYLKVNALWGKGNREQVVVFPAQMPQFYKAFIAAMKAITGLSPEEATAPPRTPSLPTRCPDCGEAGTYRVVVESEQDWFIWCSECREEIFNTEETDG